MELAGEDLGVLVEEVDIDVNREDCLLYGIRSVPTMILFRNDSEVSRLSGFKTAAEVRRWVSSN
jgi:thioredoxin-like negative regulator of GroEL